MSKAKHPRSRWVGGATPRYDERTLAGIVSRYHEHGDWRNGARVVKRK